ncbi:hypothetical protein HJFPF1_00933 [Paramyrothecium foliicola]|nr:hypothetical protein HJFPF1_00933 [Paramyrothecium foliicola]
MSCRELRGCVAANEAGVGSVSEQTNELELELELRQPAKERANGCFATVDGTATDGAGQVHVLDNDAQLVDASAWRKKQKRAESGASLSLPIRKLAGGWLLRRAFAR